MNGLINRAIACFVRDSYGVPVWEEVMARLGIDESAFEPLMPCEPGVTARLVEAVAARFSRSSADLLEDLGTYLVAQPRSEAIRRLLRFGGVDFAEFLESLEDLPDRARLAMSELDLPAISLYMQGAGVFLVEMARADGAGLRFGPVLLGMLRAMADDYGALVLLDYRGCDATREIIEVHLLDAAFADGRDFDLASGRAAP
ncbi:heme NO-binding protein [Roseovarius sp. A46]|uniref:heme NO-binding domain-containing protein n=1 Tax=Roseovarius sp. A46 TaxID=2109331 RepID=UPI001012C51C|nr:heme NO-binding domain-containing protein [Roseovarius sp. A46]RXV62727.1 heme NO-binding protein [Roseovarius sp. A46]